MSTTLQGYRLADGLGERHIVADPAHGFVEVLELSPELSAHPMAETLIERRAERLNALAGVLARVHRVERRGSSVIVTAELPQGLRLSTLLMVMASNPGQVQDTMVLSMAVVLTRALAAVHRLLDGTVHGAICPDHVVLTPDGTAMLTDAALASTLHGLEYSRERLWTTFGLVLPSAASLPRFDRRADVAQLAGVILALAIGRRMTDADYPQCMPELLASVMASAVRAKLELASQFRSWLRRALQLPARGVFASAVDAEGALVKLAGEPGRAGKVALGALVRDLAAPGAAAAPRLRSFG